MSAPAQCVAYNTDYATQLKYKIHYLLKLEQNKINTNTDKHTTFKLR